jgi:UDP:flavonoid glycosyltransferase YjiC (YdhE family)
MASAARRVLFISGSIGLGHVSRDVAIARELRRLRPDIDIAWLAAAPADRFLREAGEPLLPECAEMIDESAIAEGTARGSRLSLIRYGFRAAPKWPHTVHVLARVIGRLPFDLVLGDETYGVVLAFKRNPALKRFPFVMIYDFVGFHAMTANPLEWLGVWLWNLTWSAGTSGSSRFVDLSLFVGEEADIPDRRFGLFLPNRRAWARTRCRFVGNVLPFDPAAYADRSAVRRRLGYGDEPLVVCAIGGTSIGRELLELCGRAFPLLRESISNLRMVLVCGPRLEPSSLDVPPGVEVRGFVPELHAHFAASDLAVVQGGGTTTLELSALRRPFLYLPVEGHSEQQVCVAQRQQRLGAGVRLPSWRMAPTALADMMMAHLGTQVRYPSVPADGARRAAERVASLIPLARGEAASRP